MASDTVPPYIYTWNTLDEIEDTDHVINVNLSDSAGNTTSLFPVTVYVNNISEPDVTPPTIVIYEPAANQTVSGTTTFLTIATDEVGGSGIDRVEFYHDYALEHTATSYPYNYDWNTTTEAEDTEHIWYAKAFDNSGNESQTQPMTVFVDNMDNILPTGYILYPYAGQTVSDVVNVQISASDNIGVAQVEIFIDGNSVATDQDQPYSYEWDTYSFSEDEEHILYATITDYEGFATDNDEVEQVQFLIDDLLVATLTDSPYTTIWGTYDLVNHSEHVIQMMASDPSGNQSSAQPIMVTVINQYTGVIENLAVSAGENIISLSWDTPSDAESYKIYKDGQFMSEVSEQTYEDVAQPGTQYCYSISAVNGVGLEGPQSTEECATALFPDAPVLSLSVSGTTATLQWTSIASAQSYRVYQDEVFLIEVEGLNHSLDIGTGINTCFEVTCVNGFDTESPVSNEECGEGS